MKDTTAKRILSTVLSVSLIVCAAGCNGSQSGTTQSDTETTTAKAETTAAAEVTAPATSSLLESMSRTTKNPTAKRISNGSFLPEKETKSWSSADTHLQVNPITIKKLTLPGKPVPCVNGLIKTFMSPHLMRKIKAAS